MKEMKYEKAKRSQNYTFASLSVMLLRLLLKPVTPFIVRYYVKDASINNLTLTSYNDGINSIAT